MDNKENIEPVPQSSSAATRKENALLHHIHTAPSHKASYLPYQSQSAPLKLKTNTTSDIIPHGSKDKTTEAKSSKLVRSINTMKSNADDTRLFKTNPRIQIKYESHERSHPLDKTNAPIDYSSDSAKFKSPLDIKSHSHHASGPILTTPHALDSTSGSQIMLSSVISPAQGVDGSGKGLSVSGVSDCLEGGPCVQLLKKHKLEHLRRNKSLLKSTETLYSYVEEQGLLTPEMLVDFACQMGGLVHINLSPSFASRTHNDLQFLTTSSICTPPSSLHLAKSPSPSSDPGPVWLTKIFYQHHEKFATLKAIDLTNVPIGDDALRYLIKLSGLEALGLSGSKVTTKGIKYLAKHGQPLCSMLKVLKLCYVEGLDDGIVAALLAFAGLVELDLLGCKLGLNAILQLVEYEPCDSTPGGYKVFFKLPRLKTLRLPQEVFSALLTHHSSYALIRSHSLLPSFKLVESPEEVAQLSKAELAEQLRLHKMYYSHIYLNLTVEELKETLSQVLTTRLKEEKLWSLL